MKTTPVLTSLTAAGEQLLADILYYLTRNCRRLNIFVRLPIPYKNKIKWYIGSMSMQFIVDLFPLWHRESMLNWVFTSFICKYRLRTLCANVLRKHSIVIDQWWSLYRVMTKPLTLYKLKLKPARKCNTNSEMPKSSAIQQKLWLSSCSDWENNIPNSTLTFHR